MDALQDEGVFDSHPPPPLLKTLSDNDASRTSIKRKSYENDENVDSAQILKANQDNNPVAVKKVRVESSIPAPPKTTTVRSNIPARVASTASTTSTRARTTTTTTAVALSTQTPSKAKQSVTAMATKSSRAPLAEVVSPMKPLTTHSSSAVTPRKLGPATAERVAQHISETPKISGNMFLKRIQRELVNEVTGSALASILDTHLPAASTETRLAAVNNSLRDKAKKKWDTKDKTKKLETAVKDLRDLVVALQDGAKNSRENLVNYEIKLQQNVREVFDHLMDDAQLVAQLQSSERKQRGELESLQKELKQESARLAQMKTESVNQLRQSETQMLLREKENERLKEKLEDLQLQYDRLSKTHDETLQDMKQSQNKQNDEVIKVYQMEIATLNINTRKLESEIEKLTRDQEELSRRNAQLTEDLANSQFTAKDKEINKDVLDREVQRLNSEVAQLKETVSKKDDDLRNSMQNVYEIQRQALEEKCTMRQEAAAISIRMQSIEEERRTLTAQLAAQKEEHSLLQRELSLLKEVKERVENEMRETEKEVAVVRDAAKQCELEKELRTRAESREETERRERIAAVGQLMAIQVETSKTVREAEEKVRHIEESSQLTVKELSAARDAALAQAKEHADLAVGLKEEIQQLHNALQNDTGRMNKASVEELSRCKGELEILKQRLNEAIQSTEERSSQDFKKFQELEAKLQVSETQRRRLHNLVQELRGNIRVYARVRPFLPGDGYDLNALPEPSILVRPDLNSLKISNASFASTTPANSANTFANNANKREELDFQFDKVFGQTCSQESVFSEVSDLVQSALDGFQVCLFSYGQTGSGKTHTMNGSGDGSMRGIIPRAMEQVGKYKRVLQEQGWAYVMHVSYLEIYNETVRDLLRTNNNNTNTSTAGEIKHEIKKDAQGNVYVTELTRVAVDPEDVVQIMRILETAAAQRSVTQTLMNERSSRSHAIFTLHLKATNAAQRVELNGALNLVDLAGSERVDRSGVTGSELKETVAINKSLSALTDVFTALAQKHAHVPFRNSKLTYLLQPALSGDGKTLMIVNLSPTEMSYFESLSSLRFAKQVAQCELGKPQRRVRDIAAGSSSKESASTESESESTAATTATAVVPKKLTNTWDGVPTNRGKGALGGADNTAIPLSASLGAKRALGETASSKSSRIAPPSTRAKTATPSTTTTSSRVPPRTPGRN